MWYESYSSALHREVWCARNSTIDVLLSSHFNLNHNKFSHMLMSIFCLYCCVVVFCLMFWRFKCKTRKMTLSFRTYRVHIRWKCVSILKNKRLSTRKSFQSIDMTMHHSNNVTIFWSDLDLNLQQYR